LLGSDSDVGRFIDLNSKRKTRRRMEVRIGGIERSVLTETSSASSWRAATAIDMFLLCGGSQGTTSSGEFRETREGIISNTREISGSKRQSRKIVRKAEGRVRDFPRHRYQIFGGSLVLKVEETGVRPRDLLGGSSPGSPVRLSFEWEYAVITERSRVAQSSR